METYFLMIRNYDTNQCSIIGALSKDEEIELVNKITKMQKQGINCDKLNLDLDKSINDEIKALEGDFTFVPINSLFNELKFIDIE